MPQKRTEALAIMSLLKSVAIAANEANTVNEGLQVAIDSICEYTEWEVGHVYIYSPEQNALVSSKVWSINDINKFAEFKQVTENFISYPSNDFIGEVYTDATPMWILDVADSSVYKRKAVAHKSGIKAAFAFPIFVGRKAVAVMEFYSSSSIIPSETLLSAMANIGKQLGQIIERRNHEDEINATLQELKSANLKAEESARELEISLHKAEEANRAKSNFLANMSHELRTPMNGVLGMAHLLSDSNLNEEQKECVAAINGSAETLLMLLNDILDFSKIEAGALILENIPYNIFECVKETTNLLRSSAEKKGVKLIIDCDKEIPEFLWGDSGRVRQIITNLVGNALKFTDYGYVRLAVRTTDASNDEFVHFQIQDTGIGIPKEKLETIFDKFTQADSSVTRKYGGTGLGLAICKQLVEMMGGNIGVESFVGKGSTFWFTIPCNPANTNDVEQLDQDNKTQLCYIKERKKVSQARALLVEDYPVNQVFAKKLLKKLNFTHIDLAENGAQALLKYRMQKYDVIFMDCQMPDMDGYETTIKIRQLENGTELHTPIIAMTANAMIGDREKCLKTGMDDYISKPLKPDHLISILQGWFILDEAKDNNNHAIIKSEDKPEESPVDMEQLRLFTNDDKNEEKELVELFLQQSDEIIAKLEQSLEPDKNTIWKDLTHRMKGASGNFGAMKLHHLCKRAEQGFEEETNIKTEILSSIRKENERIRKFFSY